MQCACCQCTTPACPEMSRDVGDGQVRDCSTLPCMAVSCLSQVTVHCQVGMHMMQFHQIEPWQSMTGLPQDFNPHNPYNRRSTGHLASDMKEYPEIDPNNFTETPILYDSSLPHFPYVTHYPYDPDLHYTSMMSPPV